MPQLVENLVKSYIGVESCIVLQTMTMNTDAMNNTAARVVREMGAQDRTLGVLTKPDLLNSAKQWREILDGHSFKLAHGYHVVWNDSLEGTTHSEARRKEQEFFRDSEVFSKGGELSHHDRKQGIPLLQRTLSSLLTKESRKW